MPTILRTVALVALLALALAACGEEQATDVTDEPVPAEVEDAGEPADDADEKEEEAAAAVTVAVASTDLGDVLVDDAGMTLYMFEPDEQGPPTCYDDCAEAWPPLVTDADPGAGEGADEALLGTAERDDGATQVTYDGWPLYHFAGDGASGDTNGQGVNDVWWVLAADGTPLRVVPGAPDGEDPGPTY